MGHASHQMCTVPDLVLYTITSLVGPSNLCMQAVRELKLSVPRRYSGYCRTLFTAAPPWCK